MKKIYKKPISTVIEISNNISLLADSNKEPEVTNNIGAKENDLLAEDDDIVNQDNLNLWEIDE